MLQSLVHVVAATSSSGNPLAGLLLPLLLIGALYMLMIRPQQRRARQQRELMSNLAVGDEVVTVSGMFGTIHSLDDDEVTLEIAQDVFARFRRSAIGARLTFDEEQPADEHVREEEEGAGDQS